MSSENTTPKITEADVVAFLKSKASQLSDSLENRYASVKIEVARHQDATFQSEFYAYADQIGSVTVQTSLTDAMMAIEAKYKPEVMAEMKREAARKLLAEADALAPKPEEKAVGP